MTGKSRIPCASVARPASEASETGAAGNPNTIPHPSLANETEALAAGSAAAARAAQEDAQKQQTLPGAGLPDDPAQQAKAAKAALRRELKTLRASLDGPGKRERDERIGAQVLAWWRHHRPSLLAVYWPLSGEPNLGDTYEALAREGARLALPVVVERHAPLAFAAWTPGEALVLDTMGVAVPLNLRTVARPPALLVPCLGFNEQGYRLGYGGGFYDRTLAPAPRPLTLGIAYACQQADFDADVHDVPLDTVITELTAAD